MKTMSFSIIGMLFVVSCATTSTQPTQQASNLYKKPEVIIVVSDSKDTRDPEQILQEFESCMGFGLELTPEQQTDRVVTCLSKI